MSPERLRLLVVDDHNLFRRGLVSLLADMPEFEIVGQASNGLEAIEQVEQTHPDILLLDVNMPQMDGIRTVQELRARRIPLRILMLTISQTDEDLFGAIKAGADGYLLKNTEPEDLRQALLRVGHGQGVLSPEITFPVLRALAHPSQTQHETLLSERETQVLNCLASGETTQQIAQSLFISENTVKTHVRHILEKLEAANRTEAVSKALQLGIIARRE